MESPFTQNVSDDHPAVEILHDLEMTAYYVDENSSGYILRLARSIIDAILSWANMLNCRLEVGAPYVLWFQFSDANFLVGCLCFQR
jgi:hypothetical protein